MSLLVVDASTAAKWFLPESDSHLAHDLLNCANQLIAPDLLWVEFANILWKYVRRQVLSRDEVLELLHDALRLPVAIHASESMVNEALEIACETGATAYDSLYLALAVRQKAILVTADDRLLRVVSGTMLGEHVRGLAAH